MASQEKYTVLYTRLSQDDGREGESNSVSNQRLLLEGYAETHGFENTLFLADDGYSGTNFDRPSWRKIEDMIEAGAVATLIVKDMSRLGRNYLMVGQLTEMYFPEKGVRFIAINNSVDSLVAGSDDFNGIRNWFNEQHARDTSKKVRAVKKLQAKRGERMGGKPPYGYKKASPDSKVLVPDEETAPIVQRIFVLCASGKGPGQIARILAAENVLTPANYYYQKPVRAIAIWMSLIPTVGGPTASRRSLTTWYTWGTPSACRGRPSLTRTRRWSTGRKASRS